MDRAFHEALRIGIERFSLPVGDEARGLLERYADRLLVWNRKVSLTSVTAAADVAEKHVVDSLVLLPALAEARTLLDIGTGAGLPGVPLACVRRDLAVTCCDSVGKKVAFVKVVVAELGVNVRTKAVRAAGEPATEGLPLADAVVSRALADPEEWVPLGARYLAPGGVLLAMLGRSPKRDDLVDVGGRHGLLLAGLESYELPLSRSSRAIARWRRE